MDILIQDFLSCLDSIINGVSHLISVTYGFISSSLFLTIFGTASAAFAGSFGAQYFINKQQKKDALLSEIRNTNSAIMTAFNISNTCLTLKKQHVRQLKERFDEHKSELEQFKEAFENKTLTPGEIFRFHGDFVSIPPITVPIELLEKQMFENISAKGRALGLTISLANALQSLNRSISHRNTIIDHVKENPYSNDEDLINFYFGLPNGVGQTDTNYSDTITAIYNATDDCIYYSKLLCADLNEHGTKLKESLGDKSIVISEPDFEIAETKNLLPDEDDYAYIDEMYKPK